LQRPRKLVTTLEIEQMLAGVLRNAILRQFRIGNELRDRHRVYLTKGWRRLAYLRGIIITSTKA
jgi:hypothetical protein